MEVVGSPQFVDWYGQLVKATATGNEIARRRRLRVEAMLTVLRALANPPHETTAALRRVAEARRYPVWRMRHRHDGIVQVRLMLWFGRPGVVNVLLGGDKTGYEATWYSGAAAAAERRIDWLLRKEGI